MEAGFAEAFSGGFQDFYAFFIGFLGRGLRGLGDACGHCRCGNEVSVN